MAAQPARLRLANEVLRTAAVHAALVDEIWSLQEAPTPLTPVEEDCLIALCDQERLLYRRHVAALQRFLA